MLKALLPLALVFVGVPAVAMAQDIRVSHADLDLRSPAGLAELDRRLARAIDTLCPPQPSIELWRQAARKRCRRTIAESIEQPRALAVARARRTEVAASAAR